MKHALKLLVIIYLVVAVAAGTYVFATRNNNDTATTTPVAKEEVSEGETTTTTETVSEGETTDATDIIESSEATDIEYDPDNPHYYLFVVPDVDLNLREGPGMSYPVKIVLKKGTVGYVIEAGELWSHVATEYGDGYVFNHYITSYEIQRSDIPSEYDQYFDTTSADTTSTTSDTTDTTTE